MRRMAMGVVAVVLLVSAASSGTESKWKVTTGSTTVATVTLLTSGNAARMEWKSSAKSAPVVILRDGSKMWLRQPGGDVETNAKANLESAVANALFAGAAKAAFGGKTYALTKTSSGPSNADASNFRIRPKSAARIAAIDILGPSSNSVSATAGGRGVTIVKLADGGDYDALQKLEARDAKWQANLDEALAAFQKQGKVGKEREGK